jgi:NAD(P)-dependent dehydrogenase (short-subunit alcohol dehydrogenase family)
MDISGKTAIVTGAASGIGLGIATALAEAGANVVMADIQKDAVEQAANGLSGTNKRVMPVRIDVTQSNPCSMHWRKPNAISAAHRPTNRRAMRDQTTDAHRRLGFRDRREHLSSTASATLPAILSHGKKGMS